MTLLHYMTVLHYIAFHQIILDWITCVTLHQIAIEYNTIQYNTIRYNTIQYKTIQYNTYVHPCMHALYVHCIPMCIVCVYIYIYVCTYNAVSMYALLPRYACLLLKAHMCYLHMLYSAPVSTTHYVAGPYLPNLQLHKHCPCRTVVGTAWGAMGWS